MSQDLQIGLQCACTEMQNKNKRQSEQIAQRCGGVLGLAAAKCTYSRSGLFYSQWAFEYS